MPMPLYGIADAAPRALRYARNMLLYATRQRYMPLRRYLRVDALRVTMLMFRRMLIRRCWLPCLPPWR